MKKDYFIKLAILLFPLHIFSQTSITQLTVTANNTATQLAQAITGIGVLITNASLSCGTNGAGTFSYSGSTLGLSNGIILTTGQATDASLPAQIVSVQTGNNFSDPDLTAICTDAKYDACILQFDIVPMGDTMSIKYAFGSSEYNGYQCSQFNDSFGFFLSGPNPGGGNYTATNIATLPNGTAVSINNVNNGSSPCTSSHNPTYYIDNSLGTDIVYEGLTTSITSIIPVLASSTYHIKIAIADASDEVYDSGVFIQDGISSNQGGSTNINILNQPNNNLLAYPNPTNGVLNINYTSSPNGATLQLTQLSSGRVLVSKNIPCNSTQIQIDMSELANGVYSLSILSNINMPKNIRVIKAQ